MGATKNNVFFRAVFLYSAQHNGTLLKAASARHFHDPKQTQQKQSLPSGSNYLQCKLSPVSAAEHRGVRGADLPMPAPVTDAAARSVSINRLSARGSRTPQSVTLQSSLRLSPRAANQLRLKRCGGSRD